MGRPADATHGGTVRFAGSGLLLWPARGHLRTPLLIASCLLAIALTAPRARAGQAVHAYGRAEAAQQLAQAALELLRVGEDSFDTKEKREAYEEGLRLARAAVGIDDENADAHFAVFANHGRLQLLDGAVPNPFNLADVNRELERTLELDPNHPNGLAAKGGLYRQLPRLLGGDVNKAEELLSRSIELNENSVGARIELARLYLDLEQPERSVPLLRTAMDVAKREERYRELAEARQLLREISPKETTSPAK